MPQTGFGGADQRLGDFVLHDMIAEGGMSVLYRATQVSLDRQVVIKVLRNEFALDPVFVSRFAREARNAAALSHPSIVQIYGIGDEVGYHYIAMEYIRGQTLHEYIRQRARLDIDEAVDVAIHVAEALSVAADANIVHRDIKPSNIMIDLEGHVKVTDFGLAKCFSADGQQPTQLTRENRILGTINYMSPEQGLGKELDSRSDIYSLGVVLFEMLTGRPPFKGDHPTAVIYLHVHEAPPAVTFYNRRVPPELESLIMRMMAKDPAERPSDCHALVAELESIRERRCLDRRATSRLVRVKAISDDETDELEAPGARPVPRCLVVEDDADMADMCVRALSENGFSVLVARDGVQALTLWRERTPDLVLLDLNMPRLGGLGVLAERKESDLSGAVLILSSRHDEKTIRQVADQGIAGYLMKPVDPKTLVERARKALRHRG